MESPFSLSRFQRPPSEAGDDGSEQGSERRGERVDKGKRQLTVRALAAGLGIGGLLAFSNTYFGLQTGWVTMGSLQSAILAFGLFRILEKNSLAAGFTMEENVIVQTTAVSTATMPLAAGLVGVIPALTMMTPDQNPPGGAVVLSSWKLILWSLGLAFIGVFCAVPLRTQTILREKLRFPSGTATAHVIRTLHGIPAPRSKSHAVHLGLPALAASQGLGAANRPDTPHHAPGPSLESVSEEPSATAWAARRGAADSEGVVDDASDQDLEAQPLIKSDPSLELGSCRDLAKSDSITRCSSLQSKMRSLNAFVGRESEDAHSRDVTDWQAAWKVLMLTTLGAGLYTVLSGLKPFHWLKAFHVFTWLGLKAASDWGWVLSPSLGYVGQGMIMGPRTAVSMLAGAIAGWGVLGPIAKQKGWAPGAIMDWKTGPAGWVLWVSLAIMLGDSLSSLALLAVTTTKHLLQQRWHQQSQQGKQGEEQDAHPANERIPTSWWIAGLGASAALATAVLSPMLHLPAYEPLVAVAMALLVAVLAVRALGQTDLNPVSGVGKLSQVVFALVSPGRVVPNLVAGAVAEAGAQQAGDMMQDFKTAHLLGVSPRAQFFAMLLGSAASVFVSVAAYALYTAAWAVPSPELPAPTAMIWLDMASLVNGGRLPEHVVPFCVGSALLASAIPLVSELLQRMIQQLTGNASDKESNSAAASNASRGASRLRRSTGPNEDVSAPNGLKQGAQWQLKLLRVLAWLLPSGIGFAVGMYVSPRWTIPRVIGSALEQSWLRASPRTHISLMFIVASGLVLGEGVASILVASLQAACKNSCGHILS